MSNGIERFWGDGRLPFAPAGDRLYDGPPKLGLVIGTYAAVPYVHLQLEARRRLYPGVPTLVHDDASPATDRLRALCDEYGCDFETNGARLPHHLGDLSVYVGGLKWAERKGVELLLKLSRRWVFLVDWTGDLQALAMDSQNPTFSNYTKSYAFGFRTECFGMSVRHWACPRFYRSAIERINHGEHVFVEAYMHQFAIDFDRALGTQAEAWKSEHPVPEERKGYTPWPLMGTDRIDPRPSGNYLWHDSHRPAQYAEQAQRWGLPYTEADFADPNQGNGLGPPNLADAFSKPSAWSGLEAKYQWFTASVRPIEVIVEIGVDFGWSLFTFARDYPQARVFGVDHFEKTERVDHPDNEVFVRSQLPRFPNVRLIRSASVPAAAEFRDVIDVLHIDADHDYESVKADFEAWSPKVRPGGCVLFHDTESCEGVRRLFSELRGRKSAVTEHHGLGCWYKD